MIWTDFENTLHAMVVALTGKVAIWEKQNGPKPKKPYLTMRLSSLRRVGLDEQRRTATAGEVEVVGPREVTLSLQWLGENSMGGLTDLGQALQKPTIADKCMAAGFAVFDVDAVQELGALSGTTWEERAALDLYVRIMLSTTDAPGYIHDVTIAAEYLPPATPAPVDIPSTIEQVKVNSKFV